MLDARGPFGFALIACTFCRQCVIAVDADETATGIAMCHLGLVDSLQAAGTKPPAHRAHCAVHVAKQVQREHDPATSGQQHRLHCVIGSFNGTACIRQHCQAADTGEAYELHALVN